MSPRRRVLLILALLAALALVLWPQRPEPPPAGEEGGFGLGTLLGSDAQGPRGEGGAPPDAYARALSPQAFAFPRDHGAHPAFRNEWWYFTGNLEGEDGRRFGYQWVIFRMALAPQAAARSSAWGTSQAYMAHFAVTDPEGAGFRSFERFARGAAGLAGAQTAPLRVWLEDWSLQEDAAGAWRLRAGEDEVSIDLTLTPAKPVALNGDRGLSRKSAGAGNASYYYSISRLETRGILRAAGRSHRVSGQSWLDREWGTSALAEDQQGWDWFALQLQDGSDLMFYQLRRKDGTIDPFSAGTLIEADGAYAPLGAQEVRLEVLDTWTGPRGARYPSRWRMDIPGQALTLEIRPVLPDQELDLSVRYWEGAVDVSGSRRGEPVAGRGYVELVGY